jgi:hypothetical protein
MSARMDLKPASIALLVLFLGACADSNDAGKQAHGPPETALPPGCDAFHKSNYEVLRSAEVLAGPAVGLEDITPDSVHALRCIAHERDAVQRLRALAHHGSTAGQLYALMGLRFLDRKEFARILPRYTASATTVRWVRGCIGGEESVAEIAGFIDQRLYAEGFLPEFRITPVVKIDSVSATP